ncbi:hypothetical protein TNCV_1949421 [Trichonephila clavipes]|nr:hypothetical protein TNCV_1949421 [Trichonephila clavipes]
MMDDSLGRYGNFKGVMHTLKIGGRSDLWSRHHLSVDASIYAYCHSDRTGTHHFLFLMGCILITKPLQARCTNVGIDNWSTSATPWIACKGAFIQDPPHGKPSTAASSMSS